LLIWVGITLFVPFVGAIVVGVIATIRDGLEEHMIEAAMEAFLIEHGLWLLLIGNVLSAAVLIPMWHKMKKNLPVFENVKLSALVVTLTVVFWTFLNFVMTSLFSFVDVLLFFPSYEVVAETLTSGSFIVRILSIGIVAAVVEEVLYRGIILNRLLQWTPKWVAILISSALFGLLHLNLLQGLYAFALGIIHAIMYLRYRNLWIPIIGHVVFNMVSVIMSEILERAGAEYNAWLFLILGVLLSILSVVLMVKFTKSAVLVQNSDMGVNATQIQLEGQQ